MPQTVAHRIIAAPLGHSPGEERPVCDASDGVLGVSGVVGVVGVVGVSGVVGVVGFSGAAAVVNDHVGPGISHEPFAATTRQ